MARRAGQAITPPHWCSPGCSPPSLFFLGGVLTQKHLGDPEEATVGPAGAPGGGFDPGSLPAGGFGNAQPGGAADDGDTAARRTSS